MPTKKNAIDNEPVNPTAAGTSMAAVIDYILGKVPSDDEKKIVAAYVMKHSITRLGGKKFAEVSPAILEIPVDKYQRDPTLSMNRVKKIAAEWDDNKYNTVKVVYRDDKLYVVDGGHTRTAAILAGKEAIAIEIIENVSEADEARLFDTQDENKVRVSWLHKYRSRLFRGEKHAVELDQLCDKYDLVITQSTKTAGKCRMPSIQCALEMLSLESFGYEFLDWVFSIMKAAKNWLLTDVTAIEDRKIRMFKDTWLEGCKNDCLDEYHDRLAAALRDIGPDDFMETALENETGNEKGKRDPRTAMKMFCLDIAHGEYVHSVNGHIKAKD